MHKRARRSLIVQPDAIGAVVAVGFGNGVYPMEFGHCTVLGDLDGLVGQGGIEDQDTVSRRRSVTA